MSASVDSTKIIVDRLLDSIRKHSPSDTALTVSQLVALGDKAMQPLLDAIAADSASDRSKDGGHSRSWSDDYDARHGHELAVGAAIEALGLIGSKKAVPTLSSTLSEKAEDGDDDTDGSPSCSERRWSAALALTRIGGDDSMAAVLNSIAILERHGGRKRDEPPDVDQLITSFGETGSQYMLRLLRTSSPGTRRTVVRYFARTRPKEALLILIGMLEEADPALLLATMDALIAYGKNDCIEATIRLLKRRSPSKDTATQSRRSNGYHDIGYSGVPPWSVVQRRAAEVLYRIPDPRGIDELFAMATDETLGKDEGARQTARMCKGALLTMGKPAQERLKVLVPNLTGKNLLLAAELISGIEEGKESQYGRDAFNRSGRL